ncbi:MAG: hypothetical protein EA355_16010 [Rhodobacteraceae bacterium]|nr:MAG: hypothetical protein EA355_16010 [Paracoccaceae bacterium]
MAAPEPDLLPLARRQVVCADLVLLNKVALARGGDAARAWVRSVAPSVPNVDTEHACVLLPTLFGIGLRGEGVGGDRQSIPSFFESTTFRSTNPISLHRLHALLGVLPRDVMRYKEILDLIEKPGHRCLN